MTELLHRPETTSGRVRLAAEQVTLEYPGLFDSVTVWAVADDDGMGNGVLNECVEDNNSSPMDKVCIPPG